MARTYRHTGSRPRELSEWFDANGDLIKDGPWALRWFSTTTSGAAGSFHYWREGRTRTTINDYCGWYYSDSGPRDSMPGWLKKLLRRKSRSINKQRMRDAIAHDLLFDAILFNPSRKEPDTWHFI